MPVVSLLDVDLYKLTMMQLAWRRHRDLEVRYEFKNRHTDVPLSNFVSQYQVQTATLNVMGADFSDGDLAYLRTLGLFKDDFLEALRGFYFTPLSIKNVDGQLKISTEGQWWRAMLWETIVLSTVNELYNRALRESKGENKWEQHSEGMVRLMKKLDALAAHPAIKIVDFGTRRRYSQEWQGFALSACRGRCDCPGQSRGHIRRAGSQCRLLQCDLPAPHGLERHHDSEGY